MRKERKMSYQVSYKSESIKSLQKKINIYGNDFIDILNTILNETKIMDKMYDSPTGQLFREKFIEYLEDRKKFIEDKYLSLNTILDVVLEEYSSGHQEVDKMVGGK